MSVKVELPFVGSALAHVKLEEPVYDLSLPSPTQRLRQILDGVFLPSLSLVRKRKAEEALEDLAKVLLLKDPKIKKNVAALLPQTLRDRLMPIGLDIQDQYFTIDQITRETMVSRYFMASTYGGNMQETFPKPAQHFIDIHGMDDFMYLPTEYQPEAPQLPGAPGLWLCTSAGDDLEGTLRVFSKIIHAGGPKTGSRYQYQGHYEVHSANPPSLTVREWCAQPARFHNKWAQAIVKMGWGAGVCARVFLRRQLRREPTKDEVEAAIEDGRYKVVTAEEVKEAYFQGKERMGVFTMKCVGYDNRFQQELHDTFPTWVPPPPKSGKKAEKKTGPKVKAEGPKTRTPRKTAPRKRRAGKQKRREELSFDTDSESDTIVEDEPYDTDEDAPKAKRLKRNIYEFSNDEPVMYEYKSKGTKSRPILL